MKLPPMMAPQLRRPAISNDTQPTGPGYIRPQRIEFKDGWNDPDNSNVRTHTEASATTVLQAYSSDLKATITSPSCTILVEKGCHQPGVSHFTLKETAKNCKNALYAGTKNVHIPCS